MNTFIRNIISFSLKNRIFTFFWVTLVAIGGTFSFMNMPIEAFPDVTNTQIFIVTEWKGRSVEEVERFVTTPIELAMNPVQKKTSVRSITMFGLSVIRIIFEDDVEDFFARQQVNNQLRNISLPEEVEPEVQPPYGPTGEVYRYVLRGEGYDSRELLTIQNWVVERRLRAVQGVADVVAFGGQEKIYEISVHPDKLNKYNITPLEVYEAVSRSNLNVGGDIIEKNGQAYVVRGIGLLESRKDIGNIIVHQINGHPVLVKDLATVQEGSRPRVGQAGLNDDDDVVEGIVVMRKGENPSEVLERIREKVEELNRDVLPQGVYLEAFYDRGDLISYCSQTVLTNLFEGIVLVTVVVFLFMADWRTTFIVALIIPLSLLFAFLCLNLKGLTANLISLGAIDFGIIIDGAVVMVEGMFVALDHLAKKRGMDKFNKLAKAGLIKKTGTETGKAVFFSKLIIITALLPIFAFQKVEGKMFAPLAYTLGFALLGALIFTLTLVPVLSAMLLNRNVREKRNPFVNFWNRSIEKGFRFTFRFKKLSVIASVLLLSITLASTRFLGTEFMPQLNEGALWVTAELPMSMSLSESVKMAGTLRKELNAFPEVENVLSQTGRSNDGTDPNGFYFVQFQVDLKPAKEWERKRSVEALIEEIDQRLSQYQGITYNYSQPVIDNVAEAVAGFKASNAVKIFGDDLHKLEELADKVVLQLKEVEGIKDVGVLRNLGQPEISVILDKEKMATYGVTIADAQAVLEMAFGGKTATEKYEGERKFDVRIRYEKEYRRNEQDMANLMVPTLHGVKIPLKEISTIEKQTGAAFIYRDDTKRFIGVKFSVRERDLGSTIAEAQQNIRKNLKLPQGYSLQWTGEFENQVRASKRLAQVVPISLIAIFVLLFILFGNVKDSLLVLANVPFALVGAILALHVTGINFGISAGVGCIALFGICIQNGVILISGFQKNLREKMTLNQSIIEAVRVRTRPVVMTAMMASIGLLPAAISTGIGSESQKPLAVVIIGGLITGTILSLLVFPIIFWIFNRRKDEVIT